MVPGKHLRSSGIQWLLACDEISGALVMPWRGATGVAFFGRHSSILASPLWLAVSRADAALFRFRPAPAHVTRITALLHLITAPAILAPCEQEGGKRQRCTCGSAPAIAGRKSGIAASLRRDRGAITRSSSRTRVATLPQGRWRARHMNGRLCSSAHLRIENKHLSVAHSGMVPEANGGMSAAAVLAASSVIPLMNIRSYHEIPTCDGDGRWRRCWRRRCLWWHLSKRHGALNMRGSVGSAQNGYARRVCA